MFILAGGVATLPVVAWLLLEAMSFWLPMPSLDRMQELSQTVVADDGHLLTAFLSSDGVWRLKTTPEDVPQAYLDMLLTYEDKRFWEHDGVDPAAALRSVWQFVMEWRIVSGASTITMQSVRLLDGQQPGFIGKMRQAALAMKLERELTKNQILTIYLTLAPFGGNIEGVRMGALQYFGKEPKRLDIAEAALLIAMPQSPERRRPDFDREGGKRARDRVIARVQRQLALSPNAAALATAEPVPELRGAYSYLARHLADRLRAQEPGVQTIKTTIRYDLQASVEAMTTTLVSEQPDAANAAVIVVRNSDMAVQAYVGGGAYFDESRAGMVDLARALRSPGSTLKPVIYGMAFEDLIVHPQTIVVDEPIRFHGYAPENFDRRYRGELTVKDALIQSINTVPTMLLAQIGPDRFISRLRNAGIRVELPDPDTPPGLAVALGGVGIDLESLTVIYAGLANGGSTQPLRYRQDDPVTKPRRLISPEAARALAEILVNAAPALGRSSALAGGRRIASKTGTSYGYRDAWAIGFDADHTVAVWIGRPDGGSRLGETGAATAVPLMDMIFDLLPEPAQSVAGVHSESLLAADIDVLPARLRRYRPASATNAGDSTRQALSIDFPADGSSVALSREAGALAPLTIVAHGGHAPYRWFVDGESVPQSARADRLTWTPPGPGQVEIRIIDMDGQQAAASVWLE